MLMKKYNQSNEEWISIRDFGMFLHSKEVDESPEVDVKETDNINSSKKILGVNYTHREISVELVANFSNSKLLREAIDSLNSFLLGGFELKFRDNDGQKYKEVYLTSKITSEKITDSSYILTLDFTSYNPFRYSSEIIVNKFKRITDNRYISITSNGNYVNKPKIIISGSFTKLSIKAEDSYVELSDFSGGVIKVDNDKLQITEITDTGREVNALSHWDGGFLKLKPGVNSISISGEGMNIDLEVKHEETYL